MVLFLRYEIVPSPLSTAFTPLSTSPSSRPGNEFFNLPWYESAKLVTEKELPPTCAVNCAENERFLYRTEVPKPAFQSGFTLAIRWLGSSISEG